MPSSLPSSGPRALALCALALGFLTANLNCPAAVPRQLWIAPEGDDANVGSKSRPLATLEGARDRLRQLRLASPLPKGGVTVWLRSGTYLRTRTFDLATEDSGTARDPITYRNAPGEAAILLGGKPLTFEPLRDPAILNRLGAVARTGVKVAALRGLSDFGSLISRGFGRPVSPAHLELFYNGEPMTLARWPNAGEWLKIARVPDASTREDGHGSSIGDLPAGFHIDTNRPKRWQLSSDWWVHGYWAWDWANSYERVTEFNASSRLVQTAPPHGLYGFRPGQRFYFLNVLEELDTPGEYYVDPASGRLYFWQPLNAPGGQAVISTLKSPLIRIEQASYITFQGLSIEAGRSHGIEVLGGHHVLVNGCRLRNLGNHGIVFDGGHDHEVLSCDIAATGDGGVIATGGDRQTLESGGHLVENCHFQRQGRWSKCYVPAVQMNGVGLLARHNLIHDHPHCAILFNGNNHRLEFNEIHHVALESGDVGAIYTGRDWTYRGNRIAHNYIHDTGGVGMGSMGVYMDDCVSGTAIYGNVFRKVHRAVFLGGGRDHQVENNVFLDCQPAVAIDGRGLDSSPVWHDMVYRTMKERLTNVPAELYRSTYPALADLDSYYASGAGVPPEHNVVARNISLGGPWLQVNWHAQPSMIELADNWANRDNPFVDVDHDDFRLQKDTPAGELGIREIPFERIGLYDSDSRRELQRVYHSPR